MVRPANLQDRAAARELLAKHFDQRTRRRVKYLWADGGYVGTLVVWARQMWRCRGGGGLSNARRGTPSKCCCGAGGGAHLWLVQPLSLPKPR